MSTAGAPQAGAELVTAPDHPPRRSVGQTTRQPQQARLRVAQLGRLLLRQWRQAGRVADEAHAGSVACGRGPGRRGRCGGCGRPGGVQDDVRGRWSAHRRAARPATHRLTCNAAHAACCARTCKPQHVAGLQHFIRRHRVQRALPRPVDGGQEGVGQLAQAGARHGAPRQRARHAHANEKLGVGAHLRPGGIQGCTGGGAGRGGRAAGTLGAGVRRRLLAGARAAALGWAGRSARAPGACHRTAHPPTHPPGRPW